MNKIPKIILQTSRKKFQNMYIVKMLSLKAKGWDYIHFNNEQIIMFFENNKLNEFPDIINKFNAIKNGAHKADLFRYYFLYINGGVFIDDDAMLEYDLNLICKDYEFFSVNSSYCPGCIFQGLIGATPKNEIIYEALVDAYNIDINKLNNDYLLICRNLYNILNSKKWQMNIKIYDEVYGNKITALMVDKQQNNRIILSHYFVNKVIPPWFFNEKKIENNMLRPLRISNAPGNVAFSRVNRPKRVAI